MKHILSACAATAACTAGCLILLVWLLHHLPPEYAWLKILIEICIGALVGFIAVAVLVIIVGVGVATHLLEKDRF